MATVAMGIEAAVYERFRAAGEKLVKRTIVIVSVGALLSACTSSSTIRVAQNEAIIKTEAAPACGSTGTANVAQKQAAIETIRSGYDKYIVVGAASANNTYMSQMPGTYNTYGQVSPYGNFNATTTYQPGPIIVGGSHDQSIGIRMFKNGEPGSDNAVPAREVLGPKWAQLVKDGIHSCL